MAALNVARCPADIAGATIVSADVSSDLRLLAAHLSCGDVAVCTLGSPVRPAAATAHVLFRDRADRASEDAHPHTPSHHRLVAWLCPRQQSGEPCDQGQSHDRILVLLRPRRVSLYAIRAGTSPLSGSPMAAASAQAMRARGGRAGVRVVLWPGCVREHDSARTASDALDLATGAADAMGDSDGWQKLAGGGEAAAHMSMGVGMRMGLSMSAWHADFDSSLWHCLLAASGAMAAGAGEGSESESGPWGCPVEQVVAVGLDAHPHASHLALLLAPRHAYSHMCLSPSAQRCQAPLPACTTVLVLAVAGGATGDDGWQGMQGDVGGMAGGQWDEVPGEQGRRPPVVVSVQSCIHLHAVMATQHAPAAMWSAVKLQGAWLCALQPSGAMFTWDAASGRPIHSLLLTPAGPALPMPRTGCATPRAHHQHEAHQNGSVCSSESRPALGAERSLDPAAGGVGQFVALVLGCHGRLLCAVTCTGLVLTASLHAPMPPHAPSPLPAPPAPPMRSVLLCSPLASGRLLAGLIHAGGPGQGGACCGEDGSGAVLTVAVLHSHRTLATAAPRAATHAIPPAAKAHLGVYSFLLSVSQNHSTLTHRPLAPLTSPLRSLSLPSSALPLLSCHRLLCLSNHRLLLLLPDHLPAPLHLASSAPLFPMCHLPISCSPLPSPAPALSLPPALAALQLEGVPAQAPGDGGKQGEEGGRMQRGGYYTSVVVGGSGEVERWVGAERQEDAWVRSVSEAMGAVMAIEGDVMSREDLGGTAFLSLLHHTAQANGWSDSCLVLQHVRLCLDLMCPAPSVVRLLFLLHGISATLQVKAFHCLLAYLTLHLPLARFSRSHARYTSSLLSHAIRALLQALLLHYHTAPASPHRARRPQSALRPRGPQGAGRQGGVGKGEAREKRRGGGKGRQQSGEAVSEEQAAQKASMEALSDVLLTLRRLHTAATRLAAHHATGTATTAAPGSTAGGAAASHARAEVGGDGVPAQSGLLLLSAPHAFSASDAPQAVLPPGPLYSRLPLPHLAPSFFIVSSLPDRPAPFLASLPPRQPTTLATSTAQPLALPSPSATASAIDIHSLQLAGLPSHSAPMRAWMEGGQHESVRAMLQRWQAEQCPSERVVSDAIAACRVPLAVAFLHHRLQQHSHTQPARIQGTRGDEQEVEEEEEDEVEVGEEGGAEAEGKDEAVGWQEVGREGREEAVHVVQVEGRRLALALLWHGHAPMAAQVLLRLGCDVHASLLDLLLRTFSSHLRRVLSHYLHHHHLLPLPLVHSLACTQAVQDMYPLQSFASAYRLRRASSTASLPPHPATCAQPGVPPSTALRSGPEGGPAAGETGGQREGPRAVGGTGEQGGGEAGTEGGGRGKAGSGGAGRRRAGEGEVGSRGGG
ncbi:hypothetical protein CLOP_g25258 [Closterium sp. NIES-67]|nr:hypothetical protein CLOP_g25258 [Closterium sp. NIES-67]